MSFQVNNNNRPPFPPPFGQQAPPFAGSRLGPPPSPAGALPRAPGGPPQPTLLPPNAMPNRPSGPPPPFGSSPPPPGAFLSAEAPPPGPRPGPFQSSHMTTGQVVPPSSGVPSPFSNGPPAFASGAMHGGPRFPSTGSMPRPSVGTLPPPPMSSAPSMCALLGSVPSGSPPGPAQLAPPFSAPPQGVPPPPSGSSPFSAPLQGMPPPSGSPFGSQTWSMQPRQVVPPPPMLGYAQPPRMYGMPPPLPDQSMAAISPAMSHTGTAVAGPSKIDPNQIPRPIPSSSVVLHETRLGNQANPPPVVVFGETGPVRCSRCKGYINPFMKFIDQGRRFICNKCAVEGLAPMAEHRAAKASKDRGTGRKNADGGGDTFVAAMLAKKAPKRVRVTTAPAAVLGLNVLESSGPRIESSTRPPMSQAAARDHSYIPEWSVKLTDMAIDNGEVSRELICGSVLPKDAAVMCNTNTSQLLSQTYQSLAWANMCVNECAGRLSHETIRFQHTEEKMSTTSAELENERAKLAKAETERDEMANRHKHLMGRFNTFQLERDEAVAKRESDFSIAYDAGYEACLERARYTFSNLSIDWGVLELYRGATTTVGGGNGEDEEMGDEGIARAADDFIGDAPQA